MDFLQISSEDLIGAVGLILLFSVVFIVSKYVKRYVSGINLDHALTTDDNPALAASMAGYFAGVTAVFIGAIDGPDGKHIWHDILTVGAYFIGGILLLNIARIINDKLILYKFNAMDAVGTKHNTAVGVVQGASYIASGLIIAGSVHGEGGGPVAALVFFAIGQVALVLFALLFEKLTPYSVLGELEKNNLAAGLGFSGGLIAIGIIMMRAVSGGFTSWADSLMWVGIDAALIFVYLIVVRLFFDKLILSGSNLNKEIATDQNTGAGLLEMMVSICFALVLFFVM